MTATVKVTSGQLGIDNVFARSPFRFGVVTMEAAASATLALDVEVDGRRVTGYASDLLAYKWFDKRPEKSPADNVADLIGIVEAARDAAIEAPASDVFSLWRRLDRDIQAHATAIGFLPLGASFGVSMIERAVIDAVGRAENKSFHALIGANDLGIDAGAVFDELAGTAPRDFLPATPLTRIGLRHTVGLVDPIEAEDLTGDRRDDGLPETLGEYIQADDLRYLKIKVGGDLEADLARLERIAGCMERSGRTFETTLDGNEQYASLAEFADLMEKVRTRPALDTFYRSILFVEQPLHRDIALAERLDDPALKAVGRPLLIDEADGYAAAFHDALGLGYRGVSHKNCKGVIRSVLNAMLAGARSAGEGAPGRYFQSAEDLTCLPLVSFQADLAVDATLGIAHSERNGHHYFSGLDHLPETEVGAALAAHPDLYETAGSDARLRTCQGFLDIASLQVPGMGFVPCPDMTRRTPVADWRFEELGISANQ